MKKRFFSAFLAICMMLTILPMTAMTADPAEETDPVFEMQDFNLYDTFGFCMIPLVSVPTV